MLVEVKNNDLNGAMKRLKKKLFNEGVIKELTARRYYEKPSEKKRREKREAANRVRKEQARRRFELGF